MYAKYSECSLHAFVFHFRVRLIVSLIKIQVYLSVLYFTCLGTEILLSFQIINDDPHLCMVSTTNVPMTCLMIPIYVSDATYR